MANSYFPATANSVLKCTEKDYDELEDKFGEDLSEAGILTEYASLPSYGDPEGLYFYSDFGLDQDALDNAEELRKFVGKLIEKAEVPYWEFGEAYYCDKPRVSSCGGALFRWMPDGRIVWSFHMFPGQVRCPACAHSMDRTAVKGHTEIGEWDDFRETHEAEFESEWWKCPKCPTQLTFGNLFDPDELKKEDE